MGKLLKDIEGLVSTAIKITERVNAARRKQAQPAAGAATRKKQSKTATKRASKTVKPKKGNPKPPVKEKISVKKRPVSVIHQTVPQSVAAWPAYRADDFFQHGNPEENDYRTNSLNAAKAAGLNCIRCRVSYGMSDELGMHLLKLEHPAQPGYFLLRDSWFFQAKGWSVTRWQYDVGAPNLEQATRWLWLTKAYTKDELQYVVVRATPPEIIKLLQANPAGVTVVLE